MLHGDRAQRRQRLGLVQHALGQVGMHPHPLPLAGAERPGLVPDRVRDSQPAEVVDEPRATQRARLALGQPELRAGRAGELGDGAGMAERVRRLQVDEVRDRQQRGVEPFAREHDGERRLGVDHRVPRPDRRRGRRGSSPPSAHTSSASAGSNCVPARLRASVAAASTAADAVGDLDELRQLRQPRRERHLLALGLAGPAAAVPLLVGAAEGVPHRVRQPELLGQQSAPSRRAGRSCRPARGGRRARTRARPGSGAAAGCRSPAAAAPPPPAAGSRTRGRTCPT